jgi:undecaprenyl-phosphate 4-deoxy-4-formamido-L-arabinose transferase
MKLIQNFTSISIIIPVYNSEKTIGPLVEAVAETLKSHFERLEVILVNDGSTDRSHQCAVQIVDNYPGIMKYIKLARNFGEHNAVMCGLRYSTADCVVIIDDDFQNPPDEILKLVAKLSEGYDVVYSYYKKKHHDWFRNLGSSFNNWVATKLLKKPKGLYLSSFKAMNKFLAQTVVQYDGPYPYLDGLILRSTSSIGTQLCEHRSRETGRSNYTLRRLGRLWLNMFTSFSIIPLRISSILGLIMSIVGLLLAVFFIISWKMGGILFTSDIPPGWASTIVVLTLFSGVQLCMLGMIGEYLGRLFLTENRQPQFVVRETYGISPGREAKQ